MTIRISRDPIYRRRRFSSETIEYCVRWYITYRLSYRDLAAMMAEREIAVSHTTVMRWANFVSTWRRLLPADRELLRLIVSDVTGLFSDSSRRRLGAALGLNEAVAKNVPQQSLRRLQNADLVLRMDYGDYRVQDDALAEWLRNQDLED